MSEPDRTRLVLDHIEETLDDLVALVHEPNMSHMIVDCAANVSTLRSDYPSQPRPKTRAEPVGFDLSKTEALRHANIPKK